MGTEQRKRTRSKRMSDRGETVNGALARAAGAARNWHSQREDDMPVLNDELPPDVE